jgi:hypothetical protein
VRSGGLPGCPGRDGSSGGGPRRPPKSGERQVQQTGEGAFTLSAKAVLGLPVPPWGRGGNASPCRDSRSIPPKRPASRRPGPQWRRRSGAGSLFGASIADLSRAVTQCHRPCIQRRPAQKVPKARRRGRVFRAHRCACRQRSGNPRSGSMAIPGSRVPVSVRLVRVGAALAPSGLGSGFRRQSAAAAETVRRRADFEAQSPHRAAPGPVPNPDTGGSAGRARAAGQRAKEGFQQPETRLPRRIG